jgi:hypothetical protein
MADLSLRDVHAIGSRHFDTRAFLTALTSYFPNTLPSKELSPFELGRLVGQQDAVVKVRQILNG